MSGARIVINQSGLPAGQPGISRRDIVTGTAVTLTNADDTGVRSWRWRLVEVPIGSATTLLNPVQSSASFVPDVAGSYLIELAVDEGRTGQVDRRIAAVLTDFGGVSPTPLRIPAAREQAEANWNYPNPAVPNDDGWAPDLLELIGTAYVAIGSGGGGGGREPVTDTSIIPVTGVGFDTLTLPMGDRATFFDVSAPGNDLRVVLPTIGAGDSGRRVGVILLQGNNTFDVVTDAQDNVVTPGGAFFGPGLRPTISLGETTGYSVLTWEAVEGIPLPPGTVIGISPSDLLAGSLPTTITISGTGGTLPAFPADLDVVILDPLTFSTATSTILSAVQGAPGGAWSIDVSVTAGAAALYDVIVNDTLSGSRFAVLYGGVSIDGTADPRQPTGGGWLYDWTSLGGGGGPPPSADWATVLGVGAESGGTDPIITDGDELRFGTDTTADRRAATSARLYSSLSAPAGWSDMGDPITSPALAGGESLAVIRATFVARLGTSAGSGSTEYAVIEEAWRGPGTVGAALLHTITAEGSAGTVFRLSTDISNNIVAQIQPGTGVTVEAIAHITVVEHPGFGSV